ncbi:UNKNOWN [Stylonychia lemnae]|uniref:Uncharacterized protein n=1 Tax=Stylonychia lemnae TaxID=5949 RepID=A0A077ZTE7_STYLE|nr:UNKNOWN [Stylonychia lemnae]|eukprot:CDW73178.1 UNKNOWN [Stylonychia lemnae]
MEELNDIVTIKSITLKSNERYLYDTNLCTNNKTSPFLQISEKIQIGYVFTDQKEAERFFKLYGFANCECRVSHFTSEQKDQLGSNTDEKLSPLKYTLAKNVIEQLLIFYQCNGKMKGLQSQGSKKRNFNFISGSNASNPTTAGTNKLQNSLNNTCGAAKHKKFKLNSAGLSGGIGLTKAQVRQNELMKLNLDELNAMMKEQKVSSEKIIKEIEQKIKDKSVLIKDNKKYYGERCQDLLNEILCRQPNVQDTGERNTMSLIIKKLGIDADSIKFCFEDDDFKPF